MKEDVPSIIPALGYVVWHSDRHHPSFSRHAVLVRHADRSLSEIGILVAVPVPPYDTAPFREKLTINPVTLQHANGVYGDHLPQDWIDFVACIIERSRKTRQHIEAAPLQLENA